MAPFPIFPCVYWHRKRLAVLQVLLPGPRLLFLDNIYLQQHMARFHTKLNLDGMLAIKHFFCDCRIYLGLNSFIYRSAFISD